MNSNDRFTFWASFAAAAEDMDDASRLAFYDALIAYALTGAEPDLPKGIASAVFKAVKPNIDNSNGAAAKGKRGGRPKKETQETPLSGNEKGGFCKTEKGGFANPETPLSENEKGGFHKTEKQIEEEVEGEVDVEVEKEEEGERGCGGKAPQPPAPAAEIIAYLNEKTGKAYRADSGKARRAIKARLREGYTIADFRRVIDNQVAAWGADAKMAAYLRPETLFGTKFDGYLNNSPPQPSRVSAAYGVDPTADGWGDFVDVDGDVEFPVVYADDLESGMNVQTARETARRRRQECFSGRYTAYRNATFSTLAPDIPKAARAACEEFAAEFADMQATGAGLVLFGGYGVGKTYLACAVANAVIDARGAAHIATASDLIAAGKAEKGGLASVLRQMTARTPRPLIVLDDLGSERGTDCMSKQVFDIVDWLVSTRTPRIVTGNFTQTQLARPDQTAARVIDRVKWQARLVEVKGANRRQGVCC